MGGGVKDCVWKLVCIKKRRERMEATKLWMVTIKGSDKDEIEDRFDLLFRFLSAYNTVTLKEIKAEVGGGFKLGKV